MNLCEQKNSSEKPCPNLESGDMENQKPEAPHRQEQPLPFDGRNFTLYGLASQRRIRYVGITSQNLKDRLNQHLSLARTTKKNHRLSNWIKKQMQSRNSIKVVALVKNISLTTAEKLEKDVISKYASRLVNSHEGGFTGVHGLNLEAKEKWRTGLEKFCSENRKLLSERGKIGSSKRWGSHRKQTTQTRRERMLLKLANMRAAKARKRKALLDAGLLEREPKMERWFPFEFAVRDKRTGETAWHDRPTEKEREEASR